MPYTGQIADIEQRIEGLRTSLEAVRAQKESSKVDSLLGELARLNAERTRLLMRQLSTSRYARA
jgi:hypothetical protein